MNYIEFKKSTERNAPIPRIGGTSFIPANIWPKDENETPMLLIASIPAKTVAEIVNIQVEENAFFSIFSTYSRNDYFLDKVISNSNDEEEFQIISNNTKVIYHQKDEAVNLCEHEIPAFEITIADTSEKENFWGGNPEFLQNELAFEAHTFLMQFYAGSFPDGYDDILYLSDAVGYVFIKNEPEINAPSGFYFGQCT